jgi:multidrug resistance efflux pump
MRKFNIFYWIIAPLLLLVLRFFINQLNISHNEYFGFAENKETEINLDKDVFITEIKVVSGQKVKKGDTLLIAVNRDLITEQEETGILLAGINVKDNMTNAETRSEILNLQKDKERELSDLQIKLKEAEHEINFYKQLSGDILKSPSDIHPKESYRDQLRTEITDITKKYDSLIEHYRKMYNQSNETETEKALWAQKQTALKNQNTQLTVVAPYDGIVGSLHFREGMYAKAFTNLISFGQTSPVLITAYLQEKYIVNVNPGDSVSVSSLYHNDKKITGVVSSIGQRIVEIPEKFRKIPEVKIYGLEVFIAIPANNTFYQKEIMRVKPFSK